MVKKANLHHHQRFDFDEIYIHRASDEEVERFAIQVGNDTDLLQLFHYAKSFAGFYRIKQV